MEMKIELSNWNNSKKTVNSNKLIKNDCSCQENVNQVSKIKIKEY